MKTVAVYIIKNLINGKVYIGSSIDLVSRYNKHNGLLKRNVHTNRNLQEDYNKYGTDNFEFSILETCEKDVLIEKEQYYLDLYRDSLYNLCPNAGSSLNFKHTAESSAKISQNKKGFKYSDTAKRNMSLGSKRRKKLYAYDKEGILRLEYDGVRDAGKDLNRDSSAIAKCCRGKQKTAYGYEWSYIKR